VKTCKNIKFNAKMLILTFYWIKIKLSFYFLQCIDHVWKVLEKSNIIDNCYYCSSHYFSRDERRDYSTFENKNSRHSFSYCQMTNTQSWMECSIHSRTHPTGWRSLRNSTCVKCHRQCDDIYHHVYVIIDIVQRFNAPRALWSLNL